MKETLREVLLKIKNEQRVGLISFFNTGNIRSDKEEYYDFLKNPNSESGLKNIKNTLSEATRCYANRYSFDSVSMNLEIGLMFKKEDVNDDNTIKENAEPIEDVVRYYTGSINSYLDYEKTNIVDFNEVGFGRQGVINYNYLVNALKEAGISFEGPESFDELKERIMSGELFDVKFSVDLKENMKLTRKK